MHKVTIPNKTKGYNSHQESYCEYRLHLVKFGCTQKYEKNKQNKKTAPNWSCFIEIRI